jgi:hypothetical protein
MTQRSVLCFGIEIDENKRKKKLRREHVELRNVLRYFRKNPANKKCRKRVSLLLFIYMKKYKKKKSRGHFN